MESSLQQKQAKWWCIHFGQEVIDTVTAKKLQVFLKRISRHVVFGKGKVFLDVSKSEWKNSLHLFQAKFGAVAKKIKLHPEVWQWGVGSNMAESWVQARWRTLSPDLLPIEAISDYLNPLELERKSSHDSRKIKALRMRGLGTLQDLIEMQEDDLISQCGVWIAEFTRENFSQPEVLRDRWLENTTAESFLHSNRAFQLEDWIPEEYLQAG